MFGKDVGVKGEVPRVPFKPPVDVGGEGAGEISPFSTGVFL